MARKGRRRTMNGCLGIVVSLPQALPRIRQELRLTDRVDYSCCTQHFAPLAPHPGTYALTLVFRHHRHTLLN
ncbi:hypothetical protein BO70DRAFT_221276 [Aspergillus heteromorphus CBS 117.55]|uniref:Uncharacterized protein n=1 Tax=Aspergillus heteromorphus CBS 117.55 TaxID=1448321 RepID=A0A317WM44_9EURO|nr:uncharacterized protein BO70DRAFT_221276 [Aspergillus heteromorphus CBS 117.55]PWY86117.1 hypothetical protein BO70DRAFT_221276 [Aspergillus heteromorphus CBS 117.55]